MCLTKFSAFDIIFIMEKLFYRTISRKSLAKVLQTLGVSVVKGLSSHGYHVWKLADKTGNEVGLAYDNSLFSGEKVVVMSWQTISSLAKDICKWADCFVAYKLLDADQYSMTYALDANQYSMTYVLDANQKISWENKCIKNPFRGASSLYEMKVMGELNVGQ